MKAKHLIESLQTMCKHFPAVLETEVEFTFNGDKLQIGEPYIEQDFMDDADCKIRIDFKCK
jgi:hypothetical protein